MFRRLSVAAVMLATAIVVIGVTRHDSGDRLIVEGNAPSGITCQNYGGTNVFSPPLYSTGTSTFSESSHGASGTCTNSSGDPIAYSTVTMSLHSSGPNNCSVAGNVNNPSGVPISYGGSDHLTIDWVSTNIVTGARETFTSTSNALDSNYSNGTTESETWTITGGTATGLIGHVASFTDTIGAPLGFYAHCVATTANTGLHGDQSTNGVATV
jgi:hypothetical protein